MTARRSVLRGLALALALAPDGAAAHAVLVESVPADGVALAEAPAEIRLVFNEPVAPIAVRLLDGAGREVGGVRVEAVDRQVTLRLGATLAIGTYVVSYRVTSQDSHAVGGSVMFAIGAASARPPPAATAGNGWRLALAVNGFLWIALSLSAAGLAVFLLLCGSVLAPEQARRLARRQRAAAVAALPLAGLTIGLAGGSLLAGPADALVAWSTWRTGAATTLAPSMAASGAGLLCLAWPAGGALALLRAGGAVLVVLGFGLSGHAATVAPAAAMGPAVALHAAMAAFWWGGLVGLLEALAPGPPTAMVVRRFSRAGAAAVTLLVLLGIAIALVQVRRWPGLVETTYGWTLCGKLLLVGALLAIALHNRLRLLPRLEGGDTAAGTSLRRMVRLEIGLIAAVFAFTAALGQLPPPRTQAAGAGAVTIGTMAVGAQATISLKPGRPGRNELLLQLADADGQPLAAREVTLEASLASAGIEPIRRTLHAVAAGRYHLPELALPVAGRWTLRVEALVSDFEKRSFTMEVDIQ